MEIFQTYMQHIKHINIKINENGLRSLQAPCTQLQQGLVYGHQHCFCTPASPNCAGLMGPPASVPGQIGLNSSSKHGYAHAALLAPRPLKLGVLGVLGEGRAPCIRGDDTGQPEVTGWEPHLLSLHWVPLPPSPGAPLATRPSFQKWLSF